MFDKLYQGFPVFASLAQIFNHLIAEIVFVPPLRWNGRCMPLNLLIRQLAQLFLERAEVQAASAQAPVKDVLFEKLKTFGLFRRLPRFGRSANDGPGQK